MSAIKTQSCLSKWDYLLLKNKTEEEGKGKERENEEIMRDGERIITPRRAFFGGAGLLPPAWNVLGVPSL